MTLYVLTQLSNGDMMDPKTGQIFKGSNEDGTFVYAPRKVKLTGWSMLFQDAFIELAKEKELWGQPMAVFHFLLGKMDFENRILVQQVEIAEALDIPPSRVSEAMKKLADKGVIIRDQKIGRTWIYTLNDHYGWKGKVSNLRKERRKKSEALQQKIRSQDGESI